MAWASAMAANTAAVRSPKASVICVVVSTSAAERWTATASMSAIRKAVVWSGQRSGVDHATLGHRSPESERELALREGGGMKSLRRGDRHGKS